LGPNNSSVSEECTQDEFAANLKKREGVPFISDKDMKYLNKQLTKQVEKI
jgi:hypothetical protein